MPKSESFSGRAAAFASTSFIKCLYRDGNDDVNCERVSETIEQQVFKKRGKTDVFRFDRINKWRSGSS
jgi:hypothetical protein